MSAEPEGFRGTPGVWVSKVWQAGISWHVGPETDVGPIGPRGENLIGQRVVATVKDNEADVALICASKDLLAALQACLGAMYGVSSESADRAKDQARAAIAKALEVKS